MKGGGLSGKSLTPYVEKLINMIRETWGDKVEIIAGGGVSSQVDIENYLNVGSDHISLGTICFKPWKLRGIINYTESL